MTPEQRDEFERRLIQRAFEAGVIGCDANDVLCNIAEEMGLDPIDYSEWEHIFWSLVARGILREEGVIPADHIALSYEEWGRRVAHVALACTHHNRAQLGSAIAAMIRGNHGDS